jgi:AcrR family transcriptional regulator
MYAGGASSGAFLKRDFVVSYRYISVSDRRNLVVTEKTQSPRHRRTSSAILEAAAHVFAEDADASVDDVAQAADVGRATLYRHFPSREALLAALRAEAIDEVGRRFADASLDRVSVAEALERITRAVVVVGDRYRVLMHDDRDTTEDARVDDVIRGPIRAVIERGRREGSIRTDVPAETLLRLFGGLLAAGVRLVSERHETTDDATASVTALVVDGFAGR